jgi:LysM repeat protein
MRKRPQILFLAGTLALGAVAAPLMGHRAAATDRVIVVQPGQTLSHIAAREGVSVERLVRLNNLADPNRIYAGQRLRVSSSESAKASPAGRPAAASHRVSLGETLSGIALRYRSTVSAIARANDIGNVSLIYAGQVLRIPGGKGDSGRGGGGGGGGERRADITPPATTHRVGYGETLWGIARRYRSSVSAIVNANGIANASFIRAGQVLRIPGGTGGSNGAGGGGGAGGRVGGTTAAMPADMAALVHARRHIGRMIVAEARRQGVPPAFALAVAWQESGWQPRVVSWAGAIGVMQMLPATGEWVGSAMLGHQVNLWDPMQNVKAGVRLLKHYLARYGGSRDLALAAYYQGQTAADRYGIFPVSRSYIASIQRLEHLFAS